MLFDYTLAQTNTNAVSHATPTAAGFTSGYWFSGGGESSASVQVNEDGTVIIATGSADFGGSRASMALMAAETLGIDYHQIRSIVATPRRSATPT
jgi:CO/xanthine dehydrogenase Mo-binding subunit